MVMLFSSKCRLLSQSICKFIMNISKNTIIKNESHCSQSSYNHDHSGDSLLLNVLPVRLHQESRSIHYGQAFMNINSSHRLNQFEQSRPVSTFTIKLDKHIPNSIKEPEIDKFLKVKDHKGVLRKWVTIAKESKSANSFKFKFMTYNVLAQKILEEHMELYPRNTHNQTCLKWEHRWEMLKQKFKIHNAHIICLQEVQESHYKFYEAFFQTQGYEGIYKKRTGTIYPDGCAIFYKTKYLKMLEHQSVEFMQSAASPYLDRNNVGLIAKFATHLSHQAFIVATTHLLFNPKREDVRLAQMQVLLTEINRFAYSHEAGANIPVILCGDFNSMSDTSNGVYQFIKESTVDYMNVPHKKGSAQAWISPNLGITNDCRHAALAVKSTARQPLPRHEEEKLIQLHHSSRATVEKLPSTVTNDIDLFQSGQLYHHFNFISVYPRGDGVTTFQNQWIAVDYLFYSASANKNVGRLKCLGRYELPTVAGLTAKRIRGIPNCRLGSDHFALIANFQFDFGPDS